ncbi:hypothetical protein Tco_0222947 [Tanacetum coccineum]
MAQDNGYAFVEVQEDGTKTICIDCWFKAQPGHVMSFATRPKTDREAMWVHCLGVQRTTTAGLAGGSVATGSITVPEVIDDCMSPQRTDNSEDETEPLSTHETRSPTSNQITKVDPLVGLFVNHIRSLCECDFVSSDSRLQSKISGMDSSFTLSSIKKADNVKILQSYNGLLLCTHSGRPVFNYVYNPSTNHFKKLLHPDCSLDNSPYYRSAGLRMAFDPKKSPYYKLVDAGSTSCDIDTQI